MRSKDRTRVSWVIAFACLTMIASILSVPVRGVASQHLPRLWVRKALPQGAFEGTAIRDCSGPTCRMPSEIPLSLMLTPRPGGVQVYSLTGDYQMHLGWVPGLGGYLGRQDVGGGGVRQMQVVVDRQVKIDGVSTARRVKVELRSWSRGHPSRAARYRAVLTRVSSGLDVAIVLDRTTSMTTADLDNARSGAMAMLKAFDSPQIWVGLAALPYGQPEDPCVVAEVQAYPEPAAEKWEVTSLSPDYSTIDGRVDPSSEIVTRINCLQRATNLTSVTPTGSGHTDLGDPLHGADQMASLEGRSDAPDVIVFMTDGEANQPRFNQPCKYFAQAASQAKEGGTTIFTIGFGVSSARCSYDTFGRFQGAYATTVLAAAATSSQDATPGGCVPAENRDGDHYFCRESGESLAPPFRQIAMAALGVRPERPCRIGCW